MPKQNLKISSLFFPLFLQTCQQTLTTLLGRDKKSPLSPVIYKWDQGPIRSNKSFLIPWPGGDLTTSFSTSPSTSLFAHSILLAPHPYQPDLDLHYLSSLFFIVSTRLPLSICLWWPNASALAAGVIQPQFIRICAS